jgi:phosphatidate phosphatase APP1
MIPHVHQHSQAIDPIEGVSALYIQLTTENWPDVVFFNEANCQLSL